MAQMRTMRSLFTNFRPVHSGTDRSLQRMFPLNRPRTLFLIHTSSMATVNKRAEKMEKSREKSAQLLVSLRKKRLEGLAYPRPVLSRDEKIVKQIKKLESIKKLVTSYWVAVKRKQELTPLHKVTILECIVKYFKKSVQMRDVSGPRIAAEAFSYAGAGYKVKSQ